MSKTRKKTKKINRSRLIVRCIKVSLFVLVLFLPSLWLIIPTTKESEPMRVARSFAHYMIQGEYNEACAIATPQSVDDIHFYAMWVGEQADDLRNNDVRFKITHAQQLQPTDTTNVIYGNVIINLTDGTVCDLHPFVLKMVYTIDGWLVDYQASADVWNR